jgi:hypothetical protein
MIDCSSAKIEMHYLCYLGRFSSTPDFSSLSSLSLLETLDEVDSFLFVFTLEELAESIVSFPWRRVSCNDHRELF